MSDDHAIAWVCEDVGSAPFDEPGWDDFVAPARFSADIIGPRDEHEGGPEWAPLNEALAWARERTDRIIVRISVTGGTQYYTAGAILVSWDDEGGAADDGSDRTVLPWPDGGLDLEPRRLGGWEFLDRADDAPAVSWDVRVEVAIHGAPGCVAEPYGSALRRRAGDAYLDSAAVDALSPGSGRLLSALRVRAPSHSTAGDVARDLCAPALEEALHAASSARDQIVSEWAISAYPTGSRQALNARLREDDASEADPRG